MAGNLIYITDAGRAALVAPGNTGTTAREVTQIGLATATFVFKPEMTALPNELKRITTFGGDTVAKDTIHIVIQDDSADQYTLYGFGLYLDNGVLFGVYVQNDPILEKAPASMLLLAADTVFASIDVSKLVFGPTSFLNPPATTERKGVVELATQAEVDVGADDTRAVTPKTAAARYAPLASPAITGSATITSAPGDADAQLAIKGQAGALNREAKLRLYGTFGSSNIDTSTRLIASIRAAFTGGAWGRESVGFWINDGTANDAASDAKQKRVMNLTATGVQIDGGLSTTARPTWAGATPWDSANVTPLDKNAGGQVNATVTLYGAGDYGSQLVFNSNGYTPRVQVQASTATWMVTNGANTAANLSVTNGGTVIARGELKAGGGTSQLAPDGNLNGSLWGGWLSNFLPNNYVNRAGSTMWGRMSFTRDGWQADIGLRNNRPGFDSWTYLRARDNGGVEVINSAYNSVTWGVDDWGTMYMRGQQILNTDGNLFCSYRGAWMNTILDDLYNRDNSKANAGARVQWDSGVNNFGTIDRLNGALPAPWVVCGLSGPGNGTANAIVVYGVVLRNQ
ncbi:phage tail protein [Burkholderia ambifaria]|uniref:phage tail protein n=1 Tax=Burkholderia ambifaria TaxID=152480 RepID=UPI001C9336BF|nr:phage tail protein [Burkholderia ambifaria]MBY4768502.1 phage tail protein [Burkholderia ambifaria]